MVDVLQNFTALFNRPKRLAAFSEKHMPKVLASFMLIFVVIDLEFILSDYDMNFIQMMKETDYLPLPFYSDLLVLTFSFAILLHNNISNSKAVSLYLFSLSLSRIMTYATSLFGASVLDFYIAIFMCTISANMLVTAVFFYRGISRNRSTIMAASVFMILFYVLIISFTMHYSEDPWGAFFDNLSYFIQMILYLILLAALDTTDVLLNSNVGRVNDSLRELNGGVGVTEKSVLSVDEAKVIYNGFGSMEGWTKVDDGSPVEYQYQVTISMGDSNSEILLQKWRGSEKIHFTISNSFSGAVLYATRFSATHCVLDLGDEETSHSLRFISAEGKYIRLRVMNAVGINQLHEEVCNEA